MADEHYLPKLDIKPHKPFTFSGWLVSCLITVAVIAGGMGALFVLIMGNGVSWLGEDPAIAFRKNHTVDASDDMKAMDERLAKLENTAQHPPQTVPDVEALQKNLSETAEHTAALEKKVDQINQTASQDNHANQIMLGVTQLKSAVEEDQPLDPGIKTLQIVNNDEVNKVLNELSAVAAQGVPSKESLLRSVNELAKPAAQPSLNQPDLTLTERAKLAFGQFVHVTPAEMVRMQQDVHNIKQAIVINDLATAQSLIQQLPESPATKILLAKIQLRIKAQQLTHDAMNTATHLVVRRKEGLY